MRSLKFVTGVGHFSDQTAHPGIEFQLQQAAIFGGTDVFTLDKLQVVRDARQQEDVWQTRVNAAVGRGIGSVIQGGFLGGVRREEASVVAVL